MTDRCGRLLLECQGFAASLEASHTDTLRMLALQLQGHPRAQDFEPTGHGGSDPTSVNGILPDNAALDGKRYTKAIERAWKALREADDIRRRQIPVDPPKLDPNDVRLEYCVLHWELEKVDGTTVRYRSDLCESCYRRKCDTGDYPTLADVAYKERTYRWPKRLIDPKNPPPPTRTKPLTAEEAAEVLRRNGHIANMDALKLGDTA